MKNGENAVSLTAKTDYCPGGVAMPNRNIVGDYRYKFQGQEKDAETGKEAFELRLWDGRIGRWLTTDPKGVHHSPYLGMANNPISTIDPDGGAPLTDYEFTDSKGKTTRVHVNDGKDQLVKVTDLGDWNNILGLQSSGAGIGQYDQFINKYGATAINRPSTLPSFSDLESNYPKYGSDYSGGGISNEQFGDIVGGRVEQEVYIEVPFDVTMSDGTQCTSAAKAPK